jgi:hypothetical protein
MLEPWWLEWVFYDFSHFDNALLKSSTGLLTGSVSNKRGLSLTIEHVLGLSGFNLPIGDLFKGCSGPLSGCLYFLV